MSVACLSNIRYQSSFELARIRSNPTENFFCWKKFKETSKEQKIKEFEMNILKTIHMKQK